MRTPLYECNVFGMGYIFFFSFSLSFFWHTLWVCGIPSLGMHLFFYMPCGHVAYFLWVCIFYFFFFIARILDGNLEKESHVMAWTFILWWMEVLVIF